MATIKVKVLKAMTLKRKREGKMCYTCTAISNESAIYSISSQKESLKNLNIDSIIVLKGHNMFTRENTIFVKVCEDTKVCHIFFPSNISKLIGKSSSVSVFCLI